MVAVGRGELSAGAAVRHVAAELSGWDAESRRRLAEEIVGTLLDVPRHWIAMCGDEPVDLRLLERARQAARRLGRGMPFQYAVGRVSFRRLTLDVDERVMIPRPETESLVEIVLEECESRGKTVIDVGTGSGAIALSLAQEGTFARVIATDVSLDALAVAGSNATALAARLRAPVELRHGSLLCPVRDVRARAVVSNPPYIAFEEAPALPPPVRDWEPAIALMSAENGMAVTARIVRDAAEHLEPGGLLALEVDVRRAPLVAAMLSADARYADVSVRLDLTGRERFVIARRREEARQ